MKQQAVHLSSILLATVFRSVLLLNTLSFGKWNWFAFCHWDLFSLQIRQRGLIFMTFSMMFSVISSTSMLIKPRHNIILSAFILFGERDCYKIYDDKKEHIQSYNGKIARGQDRVEQYFYRDLKAGLIAGKGINGQYFCPGVRERKPHFNSRGL
jgi:hypothetical protein